MATLESQIDRIAEQYVNKTLFITGGTGFVGKVFLEKLLRSCSELRKIYVLTRPKKGKDPNERLKEIFKGPVSIIFMLCFDIRHPSIYVHVAFLNTNNFNAVLQNLLQIAF